MPYGNTGVLTADEPLTVQGLPCTYSHQSQLWPRPAPNRSVNRCFLHLDGISPSLQFHLMVSFGLSRTIVSGLTIAALLLAIALAVLPSFAGLELHLTKLQPQPQPPPQAQIQTETQTKTPPDDLLESDAMASSLRRAAPVVFPALSRHTATVIFVHGLGDSGNGWADAVQLWQRKHRLDEVKFVLPNARVMPISVVS